VTTREANFDGLVGPTHNYAGLSTGNVASISNRGAASNPREAALQGLAKMKALSDLGLLQGVLPPHERPNVAWLRSLGFRGTDTQVVAAAGASAPELLVAASSASPMWTANAATVAPPLDTADGRVHFTAANLVAKLHRSHEAAHSARTLRRIFGDPTRFAVHDGLPSHPDLGDEGAANHTRLAESPSSAGVHLFVYGRDGHGGPAPTRYPARQTRAASSAIARLHRLDPSRVVFAQQNPQVIDAGVFHNDVIAVGTDHVLLYHEDAFIDGPVLIERLQELIPAFVPVRVSRDSVPVPIAVSTYLFNSQLVRHPDGGLLFIGPIECAESAEVAAELDRIVGDPSNPIREARTLDLRQSMRNGGGPACLRLRVVLTDDEVDAVHEGAWLTSARYEALRELVSTSWRDRLAADDLRDPALIDETRTALEGLTRVLALGDDFYPFQQVGG